MTDFVFMVEKTSDMFITGPDVVKAALGQDVTFEQLGGPEVHASKSGVAHFVSTDEEACFDEIRKLLSFLPSSNSQFPPTIEGTDSPTRLNDSWRPSFPLTLTSPTI